MDVPPVAHFSNAGEPYDEEQEIIVSQLTSAWYQIPDADVPPGWSNDWKNWEWRWAWQGRPWAADLAARTLTSFLGPAGTSSIVQHPSNFFPSRWSILLLKRSRRSCCYRQKPFVGRRTFQTEGQAADYVKVEGSQRDDPE
jgi:hypothetical protein